jgi:hemerythrin-like domain-containing protein
VTEREAARLVAWSDELHRVHARLRAALRTTRIELHDGALPAVVSRDLLLYCHGFCTALGEHHRGEDRTLFPAIEAAHPELAPVLRKLEQDHSMIDFLVAELDAALQDHAHADEIDRHLDGVAAIMENHFAYEERQLLKVLKTLVLHDDPRVVLGPL